MRGNYHVNKIVQTMMVVNSNWFLDLGDRPIAVNYRGEKSEKSRRFDRKPHNYSYLGAALPLRTIPELATMKRS